MQNYSRYNEETLYIYKKIEVDKKNYDLLAILKPRINFIIKNFTENMYFEFFCWQYSCCYPKLCPND